MEKLRRLLEKEEKRIAKAEAKASKVETRNEKIEHSSFRNHAETEGKQANNGAGVNDKAADEAGQVQHEVIGLGKAEQVPSFKVEDASKIKLEEDKVSKMTIKLEAMEEKIVETQTVVPDPLTPTSQPSLPDRDLVQTNTQSASTSVNVPLSIEPHRKSPVDGFTPASDEKAEEPSLPVSATISDDSDLSLSTDSESEDLTSSSGSSTDNDAPEIASSMRAAPDRVPPPKKSKPRAICRDFLQSGRCRRGDACSFRHELPERGSQAAKRRKDGKKAEVKTERKGLYQRVR